MKFKSKLFYLLTLFFILLFDCNTDKFNYQYYESGNMKSSTQLNDNGIPSGEYKEYFESGELMLKTIYENGRLSDSMYFFYKNQTLKEKGMLNNGLRIGWWKSYDSLGNLINLNEYILINNDKDSYKNQIKYFKGNKIDYEKSSFFDVEIEDTLFLGKNKGKLVNFSQYNADTKYLYVVIENQYSESEIRKDTFAEKSDGSRFGVFAHKIGPMKIKGEIIETLLDTKNSNTDSSELVIFEYKKFFEKEVYVKDTIQN